MTANYGRLPSAPPAFQFRKYLSTKTPPPQVGEASSAVRVKDGGRSGQLGLRLPRQLPQGTHMERTHSHPH